jgi:hypothetical protein
MAKEKSTFFKKIKKNKNKNKKNAKLNSTFSLAIFL